MNRIYQYFTAVSASSGCLLMGILNVWPSYTAILYANATLTPLNEAMNPLELSLLGSLPSLGAMLGTAVVGWIMDRFGRKRAGVIIAVPFILSWAVISATRNPSIVLIARFISGTGAGASFAFAPVFISEVAESSIRGALASGPIAFYSLGALLSYMLGWFLRYKTILYINIAASVFCLALQALVAESPVYLLNSGKKEEAQASLAHYRGESIDSKLVIEEFSRLKQQIIPAVELVPTENPDVAQKGSDIEKEKLNDKDVYYRSQPKESACKILFRDQASRRGLLIVGTTISAQVLMGMVVVQVNAQRLFARAAPSASPDLCSVMLALVLLAGSSVAAALADKAGRKILIISSSILVAVCMLSLGILLQTNSGPTWMMAVLIFLYCFVFNSGACIVPFILLSEVFLPEVQSLASVSLIELVWFVTFLTVALFNALVDFIQLHGVFYCFAFVACANALFCFFVLPETKGLNIAQIRESLSKRSLK